MKNRFFHILCVLLLSALVLPDAGHCSPFAFSDIRLEGNRRVDPGAILKAISVRKGEEASLEQIDRDVRALYALGRFEDVTASIEESDAGPVLLFSFVERPLVRKVLFSGNEELKASKLRPLLTFKTPDIYHPRQVRLSAEAIEAAYAEEGFYAATVESKVDVNDRNEATVSFSVKEGNKVLIDEIRFQGNSVFRAKELKKLIETRQRWFLSWLTGRGTYREDVLQNDLEIIADQYFNKGYVRVKVKQPQITLSDDKKYMDLLIEIEEGDQFRIGKLDATGDLLDGKESLLENVKLSTGDIFSRALLRQSVFALNDLYADRGYADVNVAPLTRIDLERRTVDLTFDIEQGPLYHVGRINIRGNAKTRDKVVRREMKLVEGDLYSSSKLKRSRQRINNLGFFDEVKIATDQGTREATKDIDIEVKERPTGTFTLGFGYSSVDKFVGQGSITQDNFLGRALKLNLSGSFGSSTTTYSAGLLDPYFLDTKLSLGGDLYNTEREWTEFTKKTTGGDVKFGFPVSEYSRLFFIYKYEQKDIFDLDPNASDFIRDQEGESTLSSLSGSWTRNTTDYRLDPSRGSVTQLSTEFAGIGGTEKFAKFTADYRKFFPFKWSTVFSVHGQMGYLAEVGSEEVPIDERFFLGGLSSIRGFKSREVGPRIRNTQTVVDPLTGQPTTIEDFEYIGGVKEAFFNVEYTFPLLKDAGLKGILFYDIGNAWDTGQDYFDDMRSSVGWGIRWMSPMGPLRLEWGHNLDPREGEKSSEFEFSIGRFF